MALQAWKWNTCVYVTGLPLHSAMCWRPYSTVCISLSHALFLRCFLLWLLPMFSRILNLYRGLFFFPFPLFSICHIALLLKNVCSEVDNTFTNSGEKLTVALNTSSLDDLQHKTRDRERNLAQRSKIFLFSYIHFKISSTISSLQKTAPSSIPPYTFARLYVCA